MDPRILLCFVFFCALSDLRTSRIPNTLILCGLFAALLSRSFIVWQNVHALSGEAGLPVLLRSILLPIADGLAGGILPWILFGVLAALKMFGGGDVKLLSVIGVWTGAGNCLTVSWYSLVIAAIWSVILIIRRRNLISRLNYLYRYLGALIASGKPIPYRIPRGSSRSVDGIPGSSCSADTDSPPGNNCSADADSPPGSGCSADADDPPGNNCSADTDSPPGNNSPADTDGTPGSAELPGWEDHSGEFSFALPVFLALLLHLTGISLPALFSFQVAP